MERKKSERRGKSIDVKRNSGRNKLSNRDVEAEDAKENNSNTNKLRSAIIDSGMRAVRSRIISRGSCFFFIVNCICSLAQYM